jgi:topoisomerase IA-like protein
MTELYSEKFSVRVNEEIGEGGTRFREVILKGDRSASPLVFRNVSGTKDLTDGMQVELILRTIPAKRPAKKAARKSAGKTTSSASVSAAKTASAKTEPETNE